MVELKYDQHLLIDEDVIDLIVEKSELSKEDVVLEIGSGTGNITKKLCDKCKKVVCVEIDLENEQHLKNLKCKNCEIIIGNALDFVESVKFDKLISNVPYSLCEPLFKQLIKIDFKLCIFVVSRSFYDVLLDDTKKLHYLSSSSFDVEYLDDIQKNAFSPISDTKSCVISVRPKKSKDSFDDMMCAFFKQDDKLLKNAIMNVLWNNLGKTKKEAKTLVKEFGLDQKDLEYNMSVVSNEHFLKVANKLKELVEVKKDV